MEQKTTSNKRVMLQNEKFDNLSFVKEVAPRCTFQGDKKRNRRRAIFKCECGDIREYELEQVVRGSSKECSYCARKKQGESKITHGKTSHPLYRKWQDVKNRCYNKKVLCYKYYGGKGISVCEDWKNNFTSFHDFCISNGWVLGLSIERIDNSKNYEPLNCRIIPLLEQGYNKTNTRYVNYNGTYICLAKLLKELNLTKSYHGIHNAIVNRCKDVEKTIIKYQLKK